MERKDVSGWVEENWGRKAWVEEPVEGGEEAETSLWINHPPNYFDPQEEFMQLQDQIRVLAERVVEQFTGIQESLDGIKRVLSKNSEEQERAENPGRRPESMKSPRIILTDVEGVEIEVLDEKGPGGAHHEYCIGISTPHIGYEEVCFVKFQKGGVEANGINGCQNEDLIRILIDRLKCFQSGPFPCKENAIALDHLRLALAQLLSRTMGRRIRGVEGKEIE